MVRELMDYHVSGLNYQLSQGYKGSGRRILFLFWFSIKSWFYCTLEETKKRLRRRCCCLFYDFHGKRICSCTFLERKNRNIFDILISLRFIYIFIYVYIYPPPRLREWRAKGVSFLFIVCVSRMLFFCVFTDGMFTVGMFTIGMFTIGMFTIGLGTVRVKRVIVWFICCLVARLWLRFGFHVRTGFHYFATRFRASFSHGFSTEFVKDWSQFWCVFDTCSVRARNLLSLQRTLFYNNFEWFYHSEKMIFVLFSDTCFWLCFWNVLASILNFLVGTLSASMLVFGGARF